MLIGRESQIVSWPHASSTAVMRQQLVSLATTSHTLVVGLSAQDSNIKDVFVQGAAAMNWAWPSRPPAYVFAEDELGQDQRTVLRCVYGAAYDAQPQAVENASQIRSFAKPLLTALVLEILHQKLAAFLHQAHAPRLSPADFDTLSDGLRALRNRLGEAAEPDRLDFVRKLVAHSSRSLDLFREGSHSIDHHRYRPLGTQPVNLIAAPT
jgi:hypothetical protein